MLKDPTTQTDMDRNLVLEAIRTIKEKGWDLNPFTVADEANIARALIYQNVEFMAMIIQARGGTFGMDIDTSLDLARRVQHLEQINGTLTDEVRALKEELKKFKNLTPQSGLEAQVPQPSDETKSESSEGDNEVGPLNEAESSTEAQPIETAQAPHPLPADGPGVSVSTTAKLGEAIYNAAGATLSHTQIPNPFSVLTWRELETVYRFPVAGTLTDKEESLSKENSNVVPPDQQAPEFSGVDKRGVETADQEPVRVGETITTEVSIVPGESEVETAENDPVERQKQTGDRLPSYSHESDLAEQFNRSSSLSETNSEVEKVHRLEQPPMLEISHRQDGLDDEAATESEDLHATAHPNKGRKKRKRAADSTGDFDQPFEGSSKKETDSREEQSVSIPIPIITPARPAGQMPSRAESMTFNELAAIDAEAMALLSETIEESTLFHQLKEIARPEGPTVNAGPIDLGAIIYYQEAGLSITDTACGNPVQNGQAFESSLGYDHSTDFTASQEALDPTFTGFGGKSGLNYDFDWQLNTRLREPVRQQYIFHQMDRTVPEAPEAQIDNYAQEFASGEGFPDNLLYAPPEREIAYNPEPALELETGGEAAQPTNGHEQPVDLESMDIFDDFNEEDLEGIEIIDDVMPAEGEDWSTAIDTVSGDELRDLIKTRIQQAVDHVVVEPKPEEVPPPKEAEGKGLNRSKFVGGKSNEPAGGPSFVTRIVPPEIRRACLILGVRPEEMTEKIVKEAWKRQIASPGVHPDLGGETESAIYLNTAKDTLVRWLDQQAPKLGKKFGAGGSGSAGKPGPS